jgi:hypothetical protein
LVFKKLNPGKCKFSQEREKRRTPLAARMEQVNKVNQDFRGGKTRVRD